MESTALPVTREDRAGGDRREGGLLPGSRGVGGLESLEITEGWNGCRVPEVAVSEFRGVRAS